jgi:branched-chain amino acid transport system substrate-binding protein
MIGRHVLRPRAFLNGICVLIVALVALSACGSSSTGSTGSSQSSTPIKIGISVSQSGDFSADGKAYVQGYSLWADNVNKHGGLLGRQVALDFVSDASSTTQVVTNYQKLITVDHVDLILGPYSSLLTKPASVVANRYGYAMVEGSGGAPTVFNRGLHNIFDVSVPIANSLVSFAKYVTSLPASQRPTTAAYATEDDPTTKPATDNARTVLEQAGVKTLSYQVYPAETTDYTPIAQKLIATKAQIDVLGTQPPDCIAYVQAFRQQHYNPQAMACAAGPDQGAQFTGPIGGAPVAEGIMVPNGWYPGLNNSLNKQMVQDFMAKYGGSASDISADVGESYSAAQVLQQAVTKVNSLDNSKIMAELHSGDTFQTVEGPVKFDSTGQNIDGVSFLFQWQKGVYTDVYPASSATAAPEFPKPNWP